MNRVVVLLSSLVLVAWSCGCVAAPKPKATSSPATASTPATHHEILKIHGVRGLDDISKTTALVGDKPMHEIGQRIYAYRLGSPIKDFDGAQATNFTHTDSVAGAGSHHGYAIWRLPGGDSVTIEFNGRHNARGSEPGAADATNEGTLTITGGTGKYAHAHGTSRYNGVVGADQASFDCTCEIDY